MSLFGTAFGSVRGHKVEIVVASDSLKEPRGNIRVVLLKPDQQLDFDKPASFAVMPVVEAVKEMVIPVSVSESGAYLLAVFHDINQNGKLDLGFMGKPKEPYGFGNNARGVFGPPQFERAAIVIDPESKIRHRHKVKLR